MKQKYVSYSDVLIRFIEPLIDGTEDADDFMMKARMGMVAWNYHVSDQNKLPEKGTLFKPHSLKVLTNLYSHTHCIRTKT